MADLQQMSNEPVDVQSLVCSKCKKVFGYLSRAAYLQHVKGCGHQKFPCDICGNLFLTTATLRQHLKKHVDQITCDICQRSFNSKDKLRTHRKSHVDISQRIEDRVKCNLCDKTFQWKSSLNRHQETHGLRGSYSCECGKAFKSYGQLYHHTPHCSSFQLAAAKKQQISADADSKKNEHVTESVIDEEKVTASVSHTCQLCSANFSDREHFEKHVQNCDILFPPINPGRQQVLKLNHDKAMSVDIGRLVEKAKDRVLGSKSHSQRMPSVNTSFPKPNSSRTKKKPGDEHLKEVVKPCVERTGCTSEINEIKIQQDVITTVVDEVKVEQFSDGEPANIDINAQYVDVNEEQKSDVKQNEAQHVPLTMTFPKIHVAEDSIEANNDETVIQRITLKPKASHEQNEMILKCEKRSNTLNSADKKDSKKETMQSADQDCQNVRRSSRKRKIKIFIGYSTDGKERNDTGYDSDEIDSKKSKKGNSMTVKKGHQETPRNETDGGGGIGTCAGKGNVVTSVKDYTKKDGKGFAKETAEDTVTEPLTKLDKDKKETQFSDVVTVKQIQSVKESPEGTNYCVKVLLIEGEKVTQMDEGNIEEVDEDLEDIDEVDEYTELEEMRDSSSTDDVSIKRKFSRKVKTRQLKKQRKRGKERREKMYENDVIGETSADRKVWLDIAVRCTTGDCGEVVLGFKNFAKHKLKEHEEQLRYNCSACDEGKSNKGFLRRRTLQEHFLMSHINLNCVKLSFKDAEITDSTPDIYHCTKCLFMTQDQPFPIDHNCSRVGLKYFCPYCVKTTFESYTHCESHLKSEHADKVDCAYKDKYKGLKTTIYDPASCVQEGNTECVTCNTTCCSTEQLEKHVNDKHATHPYCCGLCRLAYGRPQSLYKHMKSHNPLLQCTQCGKRFSMKSDLQRHMARYKEHTKIPCDICSHKFCDKLALRRHRETSHGIITTKRTIQVKSDTSSCICEHCGLLCPDPTKLQTHLLSHKRPPLETCQHCLQPLRKMHLATHKCAKLKSDIQEKVVVPTELAVKRAFYQTYIVNTTNEVNGKNIMCKLCQKHFATKKFAKNHLRRVHCHDDQKGLICNICHKGFTRGRALDLHMRSHTGSRPYRCRICNRSFRQIGHVKEHLRSHGKLMIVCHCCPLKFKTRRCLLRHIEIHCQVFPYFCMMKTCERAFKSMELMTAHFKECPRLNLCGNVDIVCKLCNTSFSHSEESLTHVVKHNTEEFLFYKCERCSLKFGTYQKLYVHMEENEHFNNLPAVANQKSGENCVPGTANGGESTEQQTTRYFKMEEVDMDLADILNMYDYIPDEDAPVEVGIVKDNAAETEMGLMNHYYEEVIEETYPTEHVENVAGASNLMLFAEQLTSLASGDTVGCKDTVEAGNYIANTKGVNQVSDGKKWSSNLNLSNLSQNTSYSVVKQTVPENRSETGCVIGNSEALVVEGNATGVTQLLTQALDIHNYSALQRERCLQNSIQEEVISEKSHEKHVTRKLVDSLGNEVCLINDQGMPIDVNDLGDIDALDLGFTIIEVTDDEIEDKEATKAWQRQLSDGVKGDRNSLNDTEYKFVVIEDDIHEHIQQLQGHKPQMEGDQQGIGEVKHDDKNGPQKEAIKIWDTISPTSQVYDENSVNLTDEKTGVANVDKILSSFSSDVQEFYVNPDTTVLDVETVNYKISLNRYENRNNELLPYKCEVCGKHFKRVKYLNRHKKIHLPSSQRKFICQVCGVGFTTCGGLRTHKRTHTNDRPYPCSKCDKSFRQIGHLQSHLRIHEGSKPFQCSHCGNKYTTNSQLKQHVIKHHRHEKNNTGSSNNEQVACSSCGETFLDSGELTVHKLEHLGSQAQLELLSQFSIEEVKPSSQNNSTEKVKQSVQKLNAKRKTDKSQDTFSTVCDTCGIVFRSKVSFKIHSRRHKVEAGEMYQCQHCPTSIWETQEQLDKHVAARHTCSIQCDQCGLQIENFDKLRWHKKKEHTGREIKCSRCQHVFVSASGFVTHVKNCFGQQFLSKLQEATK